MFLLFPIDWERLRDQTLIMDTYHKISISKDILTNYKNQSLGSPKCNRFGAPSIVGSGLCIIFCLLPFLAGCEALGVSDESEVKSGTITAIVAALGGGIGNLAPAQTPSVSGDVIITEMMINPESAPEITTEWLELYNGTSLPLELQDCELHESSNFHTIASSVILIPGQYVTLATSMSPGGFTPTYNYNDAVRWSNSGETATLSCASVAIDSVDYSVPGFPTNTDGRAISLDPDFISPTANDSGANWCHATNNYDAGNYGSPGSANPDC